MKGATIHLAVTDIIIIATHVVGRAMIKYMAKYLYESIWQV